MKICRKSSSAAGGAIGATWKSGSPAAEAGRSALTTMGFVEELENGNHGVDKEDEAMV